MNTQNPRASKIDNMDPRLRYALAALLIVVSVAAVAASIVTQYQRSADERATDRYEQCQADVYNRLIVVLADSRTVSAEERKVAETEREALDTMLESIRDEPRGFQEALNTYLDARATADATRAKAEETRAKNPLPEPPAVACAREN